MRHLVRDEKLMEKFERALNIDPNFSVSWDANRDAYDRYVGHGLRARHVMTACPALGMLLWVAFAAHFAIGLFAASHA